MEGQLTPELVRQIVERPISPDLDFPEILKEARVLSSDEAVACVEAVVEQLGLNFSRYQEDWQDVVEPWPTIEKAVDKGNPTHIAFAVLNARRHEDQGVAQPTPFEIAQALGQAYNKLYLDWVGTTNWSGEYNDLEIKEKEALELKEIFKRQADLARRRSLLFHALKDPLREPQASR